MYASSQHSTSAGYESDQSQYRSQQSHSGRSSSASTSQSNVPFYQHPTRGNANPPPSMYNNKKYMKGHRAQQPSVSTVSTDSYVQRQASLSSTRSATTDTTFTTYSTSSPGGADDKSSLLSRSYSKSSQPEWRYAHHDMDYQEPPHHPPEEVRQLRSARSQANLSGNDVRRHVSPHSRSQDGVPVAPQLVVARNLLRGMEQSIRPPSSTNSPVSPSASLRSGVSFSARQVNPDPSRTAHVEPPRQIHDNQSPLQSPLLPPKPELHLNRLEQRKMQQHQRLHQGSSPDAVPLRRPLEKQSSASASSSMSQQRGTSPQRPPMSPSRQTGFKPLLTAASATVPIAIPPHQPFHDHRGVPSHDGRLADPSFGQKRAPDFPRPMTRVNLLSFPNAIKAASLLNCTEGRVNEGGRRRDGR